MARWCCSTATAAAVLVGLAAPAAARRPATIAHGTMATALFLQANLFILKRDTGMSAKGSTP